MKMTAIETIRLGEFPNLLWLHIHTDQGLVGLGETFFGARAVEAQIHESVAPLLIGKPALQIDRHARTLQNQYLGFSGTGDQWYLMGWCRLRGGGRTFRLDRIEAARVTEELAPERTLHEVAGERAEWMRRPELE